MAMSPAESISTPLSPDEIHEVNPLNSNPNPLSHHFISIPESYQIEAEPMNPPLKNYVIPPRLKLDLWKLIAMFGAIFESVTNLAAQKQISNEFMQFLLFLLTLATLSFVSAHTLQDKVPKFAMTAMYTGIVMVIALFHAVVLELLDPSHQKLFWIVVSILVVAYSLLLVVKYLYNIVFKDVKEINTSGNDTGSGQEFICTPPDAATDPSPK